MPTSLSPRRHTGRALLALLAVASGVTANPGPVPCPPPYPVPCPPPVAPCAPCQSASGVPPRIVVNVPPPEIVYQDAAPSCRTPCLHPRWSLFNRPACGHAPAVQTQTVMLTPMPTTGASFGTFNGGVNFGTANVTPTFVAQAQPTFIAQATSVQQTQGPSGLAAIHQAELYAASVSASRAQQDAEMRVMMAALDRARGSMAAASTASVSSSGGCPELSCESMKTLIAATTVNTQQLIALNGKLDKLQQRLDDLTKQVESLDAAQEKLNKIQLGTLDELGKLKAHPALKPKTP